MITGKGKVHLVEMNYLFSIAKLNEPEPEIVEEVVVTLPEVAYVEITKEVEIIEESLIEVPECEKKLWKKYRKEVWKITDKQNLKSLVNFDKRGFRNYHLDHKVSIWYGYKNTIVPKLIGSIDNLEMIPYKQNMLKGVKCKWN